MSVTSGHSVYDLRGITDTSKELDVEIARYAKTHAEYKVFYLCKRQKRVFGFPPTTSSESKGAHGVVTDDARDDGNPSSSDRQELREKLGIQGVPEPEEERMSLYRRYFPTLLSIIDALPDQIAPEQYSAYLNQMNSWIVQDEIRLAGQAIDRTASEEDKRLKNSLEGEARHYAISELKRRFPRSASDTQFSTYIERRVRERFPRTWLFLERITGIRSNHDFDALVAKGRSIVQQELLEYLTSTRRHKADESWYIDASFMYEEIRSNLTQKQNPESSRFETD